MYHHFNRERQRISKQEWVRLRDDPTYRFVREFDNGEVFVRLTWVGRITNFEESCFEESWPIFTLSVANYDASGNLQPDPVFNGRTFPNEVEAIKGYESFLEQYGKCHRDDEGKFVEVDNTLTPPPPPDPDKPSSVMKELPGDFAAW